MFEHEHELAVDSPSCESKGVDAMVLNWSLLTWKHEHRARS